MKRKPETDVRSLWITIPTGALISMIWATMMCALTAILMTKELILEKWVEYVVLSILMLSSYVGVKYSDRMQSGNCSNISYLSGLLFLLILIVLNAATCVPYDKVGVKLIASVTGSALGCIKMPRKGRRTVHPKRRHYR